MTLESEDVFSVLIPQEMYDLIIEQLSDNSSTLAACSLTCRAWEPSARLHLFRTLRVPEDTDSIANWTQRLQNAPHVARWVRELEVPTFVGIGQLVPSVFPGVRHITVGPAVVAKDRSRGDMSKCYKEDALSPRAISHIKTLSLKRMEITDIELVLLMSHASTLSSLALDNVTMFTIDPVRVRDLAPQMHGFLTTLNVQNASKNLVKRLLKIISPYQLRILQFPVGNIADAEQLYGILESPLSSLEEVTITIANRAQTDGKLVEYLQEREVLCNHHLRALHIQIIYNWRECSWTHEHDLAALLLSKIHASRVSKIEVTVQLSFYERNDLIAVNWKAIACSVAERTPCPPYFIVNVHNRINYPGWTKEAMSIVACVLQGPQTCGMRVAAHCRTLARRREGRSDLEHKYAWIY